MTKIDGEQLVNEEYRSSIAEQLGLMEIYAYHCYRCNYTWLPKDFDFNWREPFRKDSKWKIWGHDLFFREPPKSCARCKSKYWKEVIPRRKLKVHPVFEGEKWINEKMINDISSPLNFAWINSLARLRALERQGKLTPKDIAQF